MEPLVLICSVMDLSPKVLDQFQNATSVEPGPVHNPQD